MISRLACFDTRTKKSKPCNVSPHDGRINYISLCIINVVNPAVASEISMM